MSTLLTINVTNNAAQDNNFFFFQKPAIYVGGLQVYSNSLYQRLLKPFNSSGTILTFQSNVQYYAAVQEASSAAPPVGSSSGYESSIQAVNLTAPESQAPNCTTMVLPLGLTPPTYDSSVEAGAFRIKTAKYNSPPTFYNAGSAVMVNGGIVLSNFINAQPQDNIDCQPILTFYVSTGTYTQGTVMNFTQSAQQAALCDFTGGYTTANVTYNNDGSWTVNMS
ncbi:MAG: hypothetical protein NT917_12850 [Microcystis aeruginosa WS75]|nr:hypothetical protein [Microcystis aeruginosa WS75]